ncbi:MAG: hypothetical protein HYT98_04155 [Candidatus Sungbacteria bacterium]|nr:hypothetical protein [Candidatus Sungbacteria bacterium]
MKVVIERSEPIECALERLYNSVLLNTGEEKIYYFRTSTMRLADFRPQEINPTSLYVLRDHLEFQRELHSELLAFGIDTFRMDEVIHYRVDGGELWGMAPPVVEIHEEFISITSRRQKDVSELRVRVALLEDGEHRAWCAMKLHTTLRCILISDTDSAKYPFVAYPVSWADVKVCDAVPSRKRYYRNSQNQYVFARPLHILRQVGDIPPPPEIGRK